MLRQLLAHLVAVDLGLRLVADCQTVAEGTATLLREKPDLAIVDWMLPDGRGFDIVRAAATKLPRLRWLFLTSSEQGHIVHEAVALGVHGFVMKRSDLGTLRTAVQRVLAGEKYYCEASSRLLLASLSGPSVSADVALTPREREVLRAYARGENTRATAQRLAIAEKTVQNTLTSLRDKLGLHEPAALVHYAIKHGYVSIDR